MFIGQRKTFFLNFKLAKQFLPTNKTVKTGNATFVVTATLGRKSFYQKTK